MNLRRASIHIGVGTDLAFLALASGPAGTGPASPVLRRPARVRSAPPTPVLVRTARAVRLHRRPAELLDGLPPRSRPPRAATCRAGRPDGGSSGRSTASRNVVFVMSYAPDSLRFALQLAGRASGTDDARASAFALLALNLGLPIGERLNKALRARELAGDRHLAHVPRHLRRLTFPTRRCRSFSSTRCMSGVGTGISYSTPMQAGWTWFPKNKDAADQRDHAARIARAPSSSTRWAPASPSPGCRGATCSAASRPSTPSSR